MSYSSSAASDPRVIALRAEFQAKQRRFLITAGVTEIIILVALVIALFVLNLVDDPLRIIILFGGLLVCSTFFGLLLVSMQRTFQRDLRDITGQR